MSKKRPRTSPALLLPIDEDAELDLEQHLLDANLPPTVSAHLAAALPAPDLQHMFQTLNAGLLPNFGPRLAAPPTRAPGGAAARIRRTGALVGVKVRLIDAVTHDSLIASQPFGVRFSVAFGGSFFDVLAYRLHPDRPAEFVLFHCIPPVGWVQGCAVHAVLLSEQLTDAHALKRRVMELFANPPVGWLFSVAGDSFVVLPYSLGGLAFANPFAGYKFWRTSRSDDVLYVVCEGDELNAMQCDLAALEQMFVIACGTLL